MDAAIPSRMFVVLLDSYHLGDPLFIPQLARDVAARKAGAVFVHGSGEAGERVLESRGLVPASVGGVWAVSTPEEAADVERATRDLNRRIVHEMNEAGTPAVRVMAADRGLVREVGGAVRAGRTAWLATLVAQGGVAVVAALVAAAEEAGSALVEADVAAVAAALAEALGADGVALVGTGRVAALADATEPVSLADADAAGALADAALAARVVALSTVPVRLVSASSLRSQSRPAGPILTS